MNEWFGSILIVSIFLLSMIVHEFGHWLAFRMYGIKPKFSTKSKVALTIGDDELYFLKPKQIIVVAFAGIIAGYLPLILLLGKNGGLFYLLEFFFCIVDLSTSMMIIQYFNSDKTLLDIEYENLTRLRNK